MDNNYETIKQFLIDNNTSDEEMTKAWKYVVETNWKARAISKSNPNWYNNNLLIMKQTLERFRNKENVK